MNKAPAFQFYVKDWLSDAELRRASPATRGIWIDLLCYMWWKDSQGILELSPSEIQRMTGANEAEMQEFLHQCQTLHFCDMTVTANGSVTLKNRRMYREAKEREKQRVRTARYRDKHTPVTEMSRACNENVTSYSPKDPSPTPKKILKRTPLFSLTSDEVRLAELLRDKIKERKPDFKFPDMQQWAKDVDLMMRIDKRTPERITRVIEWCQQDEFWQNNILSTAKLRKQYDKLELKMGIDGVDRSLPPELRPGYIEGKY